MNWELYWQKLQTIHIIRRIYIDLLKCRGMKYEEMIKYIVSLEDKYEKLEEMEKKIIQDEYDEWDI